ncbi:MAG: response regulator transcription factor [Croceitalea sp.]|nr:response regulator transcription factor [Croceitalea sp.]MBT8237231.1 response regulator transcription factor [Croceitalea sp.]NNC34920.1 response regulator transcription factor [Croceitalea sp.]NNL08843.1 response regulator transcription factor [Croceitalea sp.]NNM18158.1 response regulator transcription factor [Croceitalea sp.]
MVRLVIIEDLPIVLEGIKLLINNVDDFQIVGEYRNGQDFVADMANLEVDVVLTDIDMPIMDGVTATKMALSVNPELKIIALSMYNDRKYYYEMVTAGAKGFVLKQSPTDKLENAIREVYKGGNYFSEELLRSVIIDMQNIEDQIIDERKKFLKLTERESKLLDLVCQGLTNKELADKLFVSVRTIETTKSRLMEKTNTRNNAGLIIWAIKNKVVVI